MYSKLRKLFIKLKYYRVYRIIKKECSPKTLEAFFRNPKVIPLKYFENYLHVIPKLLKTPKYYNVDKKIKKALIAWNKHIDDQKIFNELDSYNINDSLLITSIADKILNSDYGTLTSIELVQDLKEFNKK